MASNLALDARRGDLFYIDHNDPKVVIELNTNKNHPLYDPRVERPVIRETVDSIKMRGQEVPAEGYKQPGLRDGKQVVVLTKGRGRWKAIQVAWAEMLAEGASKENLPPFRLIVKRYVNDLDAFEAAVIENVHREQEDDISMARKLLTYLNKMGNSQEMRERARIVFNLKTMGALDSLLKLLDLNPEAKAAVSGGTLSKSAGEQIAMLTPEQQAKALEEVKAKAGNGKKRMTVKEVEKVVRKITGKAEQTKMMGRREVKALLATFEEKLAKGVRRGNETDALVLRGQIQVLKQVLGESDSKSAALAA